MNEAGAMLRHHDSIPANVSIVAPLFIDTFMGIAMKAKTIAVLIVASAASLAVPAFADDSSTVAPASHAPSAVHAMSAKHDTQNMRDMPDAGTGAVGGGDAYKTQSGKREERDSIDAWLRGG